MMVFNIKTTQKCAFCKYWYDPTYNAVEPKTPQNNMWSIKTDVKKMCTKKGYEMASGSTCGQFRCRLEDYIN